jgi:hypothetical protein
VFAVWIDSLNVKLEVGQQPWFTRTSTYFLILFSQDMKSIEHQPVQWGYDVGDHPTWDGSGVIVTKLALGTQRVGVRTRLCSQTTGKN